MLRPSPKKQAVENKPNQISQKKKIQSIIIEPGPMGP